MNIIEILKDPQFVVSTVLAIILAGLGILYTIRVRSSEITFSPTQFIFLVDNILSEYDNIEISYNSKSIDKNITLFKGIFINTGKDDIDFANAERKLKIKLPTFCKVIKAEIKTKSENLEIEINSTKDYLIEFNLGLFKRSEFFQIEAIVSFPNKNDIKSIDSKNIYSLIDFEYRVKNLKQIKKLELNYKPVGLSTFERKVMIVSAFIFFPAFIILDSYFNPRHESPRTIFSNELTYVLVENNGNDSLLVRITPYNSDSVEITSLNTNFKKVESLNDFYYHSIWIPKITKVTEDQSVKRWVKFNTFLSFFLSIEFLFFLFLLLINIRKRNKITKLIESSNSD